LITVIIRNITAFTHLTYNRLKSERGELASYNSWVTDLRR